VVTPDSTDDTDAWKTGKIQINGSWTYSGTSPSDEEGASSKTEEFDLTFTATSVGLTYDKDCAQYWKSGEFRFDVGNGHVFKYVYSCDAVKYYYDGKEFDPAHPDGK
jgi:hypothetical protein